MITKSKQKWAVGQEVRVGFISGLLVVAAVATPGDFAPDAYVLSRNDQFYAFVPHNGLRKIDEYEARELVRSARLHADRLAHQAIAAARASARHAEIASAVMVAA